MSLDEKHAQPSPEQVSTTSIDTDTHRLDLLDNLEILPQILQEGILFAGSGSALLLQAASPGVRDRTTTGPSPSPETLATELTSALQATLSYLACLVFGTRQEKKTLLDLIQRGQPPLRASETYSADPASQVWVAATLYATATDFYQRVYGRVNYRTAERAYAEFTVLMNCMGLTPGAWPDTRASFWQYWDDQIEGLNVSEDAHRFAQDLMHRTELPRWVAVLKPLLRVITIEMLPPRLREAYGLQSTWGSRGLYRSTMGFAVAVYPALPSRTRGYPLMYYLDELRRHLNVV